MSIGARVKELRKSKGWNQTELGEKINLSFSGVSLIEADKNSPSIEVILKLSELFGVSADYLLSGKEDAMISPIEQEIIQAVREDSALLNSFKEVVELKKKVMSQIKQLSRRSVEERRLGHA